MNGIYIYCISDKPADTALTGILGLQTKSLQYKELHAIYSLLDSDIKYDEENFYDHEHVLEALQNKDFDILPFRFGTCMTEADAAVLLSSQYHVFLEKMQGLAGKVEMSVRALWNYGIVLEKMKADLIVPQIVLKNKLIHGYWEKKMEEYKLNESVKTYAREESEKIHKRIMSEDFEGSFTLLKTDSMFFNACYLVKKTNLADFRSRFSIAISGFPDYKFLMTGPWPPFNFCNLTI